MRIIPMNATPPQTYALGRTCLTCGVPLSRYNETDHCSIHQPEPDMVYCGYLVLICENCGESVAVTQTVNDRKPRRTCRYCGARR